MDAFDRNDCGLTALMWASSFGQCHTCQDLLAAGAVADLPNSCGQTALHFAAKAGYPEVINVLMSFGADVNCPDEVRIKFIKHFLLLEFSERKYCTDVRLYGKPPAHCKLIVIQRS